MYLFTDNVEVLIFNIHEHTGLHYLLFYHLIIGTTETPSYQPVSLQRRLTETS